MATHFPLGNDVVDWQSDANLTSAANPRLVARVLDPAERVAAEQPRVFWAYWAAKEAAYKALKKHASATIFSHRRFVVAPCDGSAPAMTGDRAQGVVTHGDYRIPVTWNWTDNWVHCVTGEPGESQTLRVATLDQCRALPRFADLKHDSGLSDASVAARIIALTLLDEIGVHDAQIERAAGGRRQGPPRVVCNGVALRNVEVSLSHDGRFVAAAVQHADDANESGPGADGNQLTC